VNVIDKEPGCDWRTVNDAVLIYETALDDAESVAILVVEGLWLHEVLFVRLRVVLGRPLSPASVSSQPQITTDAHRPSSFLSPDFSGWFANVR